MSKDYTRTELIPLVSKCRALKLIDVDDRINGFAFSRLSSDLMLNQVAPTCFSNLSGLASKSDSSSRKLQGRMIDGHCVDWKEVQLVHPSWIRGSDCSFNSTTKTRAQASGE